MQFNKFLLLHHASAGVGRTGTLIAIDTLLEQVEKAKMVDVCGVITKMRHQRMKMVQTTVSVKNLKTTQTIYTSSFFQCLLSHRISSHSYMM